MEIYLLRHGKTKGNLMKRYVGRTDEPLLAAEIERLRMQARCTGDRTIFSPELVFTSPMLRCLQTAECLFTIPARIVPGLRETDFGSFEYHNYEELKDDPAYQRWIDSGGLSDYPDGEPGEAFRKRTRKAFFFCLEQAWEANAQRIAIVCHGGVIMSILSGIMGEDTFYDWQAENGSGFFLHFVLQKEKNRLQWEGTPEIRKL